MTGTTNLPLTRNQKRLWFLSKLHPDVPLYIIRSTFRFKGLLYRELFERSLEKLFQRHHVVYSVIKEIDSEPYCDIVPRDIDIPFEDLTGLPENERLERIKSVLNEDARKGFDMEKGPLYRLYLIKTAGDEHYFHMSIHHVIFDGWSQGVFVNDLSEIYNGLLRGEDVELGELKFQQYDYALWESGKERNTESVSFWEENLRGCSPVLNFPHDYPRSEQSTGRGGLESVTLSRKLSDDLRRISKEEDTSLFATLMSVFGLLMKKYSGEDDINIGLPVAYRPYTGLEKIFGMFVNTVVVRMRYEKEVTFRELIKKTDDATMDAISHQDITFEDVVEIIKPERVSGANPLFQVAFVWQNNLYVPVPVKLDGVRSEVIKGDQRTATFDLSIAMWENGDIIEGEIEYNIDIIKPETIKRLKEHFLLLINNLTANINMPVNSVPMISDEEIKMISEINNTSTDYPRDKTMVELFEGIVTMFPDKIAIAFKGESYTYRQLNKKSNQLARILRESGVGKNTPVGLFTDKSLEMIVGMLAILKAGGCYAPVDPEYPLQRINFIVKDSGIKAVLVQGKYMGIEIEGVQKLNLNSQDSYNRDNSNLQIINDPEDLAYIIYTSGTTGVPKGTPILHRCVLRTLFNTNLINITTDDRFLQQAPIVFDMSTLEIWGPLLHGGSLYIIDKETLLNPDALGDELLKNEITVIIITPAIFTKLFESQPDIFKKIRYIAFGGDVMPVAHINRLRKVNPDLIIINGYGPTENTCASLVYSVKKDFDQSIPIGRPNSNSTAYIFDKYLNYQPIGVIGELYVGGDGLSPGYLNREDLNKICFIENPHNPGERLYKTGDLVRWLPDWNIEFLGRADNQLKIRGFRVELEEIESVLSEIEGVIEAVIKPVKVEQGDYGLVAFLNVPESFMIEKQDILAKMRAKLPVYMIPSAFKLMHGFPKTINGKTDRKALNIDTSELEKRESVDITTLSPTARTIHEIWCDTLKTNDVLVTDSFFDIGGNSLLSIRVINQIKEKFGVTLTFKNFIANSTISQLSAFIDSQTGVKEESIDLVHLTDTKNLPLTKNQKRLWFISRMQPDVPSYILPLTYMFQGLLNREIFERSLDILFERHYIVFSVFKESGGEPYCEIVPREVKLTYIDYTGVTKEERKGKITAIVNEDSRQAFDLGRGPLYRLYLIKAAEDEYYFHMSIHHIIFDGWSWGVLVNDLSRIYNSLLNGKEIGLEELEFQQYDYAQWEKSSENIKNDDESIEFWRENLQGCSPILNFPFDFQRREQPTGRGSFETIQLSKDLSEKLRRISKKEDSSLFATMLSAFGIQMQKYSGEDDINIGLPVAYRPHTKLEKIFGMFVNTVVVRLRYEKEVTFRELIKQSNDAAMNAISHQDLPFERVVEIVKPERIADANPLFQVAFAWQNNLSVAMNLDGVRSERIVGKERTPVFDIILSLWENGNNIEGEIEYNLDILKTETITRLRDHYLTLLNNLVENIDVSVSSVPMISEEEKKLIDGYNNTQTNYPKNKTIAQLFEDQVKLYPEKTAIVFKDAALTYKQLNEKTNQLARTLRASGVGNNTPVGILAEKSLEMIVGILGILKAGGCYTPIDIDYPEQRMKFVVKDSSMKILLAQDKYMGVEIEGVQKLSLNSEDSYNIYTSNLQCINHPEDFAYILYTSGTTGIPKGTPVPQRGVVRLVCNTNYIEYKSEDRILLVGAIVFDASTQEIWGALLNGGSLYIVDKEVLLNPKALEEELLTNGITILTITPALFNHLVESRISVFSKLRCLIIGGDVLSPDHAN
ncbi:MAG TPA: amino acid adenylation domain-containing protein, partial [Bacteroidales bacterium]|nr:amino acid adenylation domain-containing protein [Bacteroidales bacterium]